MAARVASPTVRSGGEMRRLGTEVLLRSVVRIWTQAIAEDPTNVVILSPYVTSRTADVVLGKTGRHVARLYTVFEARLFASVASQIGTLKRLAREGQSVFHVPALHAKVLLTGRCATVGSQNLTGRGAAKNLEATVVIRDPTLIERLRGAVEGLVQDARPVSLDEIAEMERAIPPLRRTFRSFEQTSKETDRVVAERATVARAERVREQECARAKRLALILGRSERSSRAVSLQLRRPHPLNRSYQTLLCRDPENDITRWALGDERVDLVRRKRYLVLMPTTGRVAWVAVNKTRLSQFGTGLSSVTMKLKGKRIGVRFDAVEDDADANVSFTLRPFPGEPPVTLRAWFDIESIHVREPDAKADDGRSAAWLREQLGTHRDELTSALVERLLQPFTYERNRTGRRPDRFIATGEQSFSLRLHRRGESPFLVLAPT